MNNKYQLMFALLDVANFAMMKKMDDGEFSKQDFLDTLAKAMQNIGIAFNVNDLFTFESTVTGDLYIRISKDLKDKLLGVL